MADCTKQGLGRGGVLIINNLIVSVPSVPCLDCVFSHNSKCLTLLLYIDNRFKINTFLSLLNNKIHFKQKHKT